MSGPKTALLIVISGPPCSGKSSLAEELSRRLGITHLELDRLRAKLLPRSTQSEQDRDTAYRAMHLVAEHLLLTGQPVILDATYGRTVQRAELAGLSNSVGASVRLVHCRISADEAIRRFKNRTDPHFAVDLTEQRVGMLAGEYVYDESALIVSEENTVQHNAELVERYLRT